MSGAHNLWLQNSINQVAITRAQSAINRLGRALPCRVTAVNESMVTVAFEVNSAPWTLPPVTIPKNESSWIRYPIQVGDTGLTQPSDVYLGGISGLGGGVADMTQRAPLTALMFTPCASTGFSSVNTNAAFVSGPEGVVLQDKAGDSIVNVGTGTVTITANTSITLSAGGKTWTFSSAGLTDDSGVILDTHIHEAPDGATGGPENP